MKTFVLLFSVIAFCCPAFASGAGDSGLHSARQAELKKLDQEFNKDATKADKDFNMKYGSQLKDLVKVANQTEKTGDHMLDTSDLTTNICGAQLVVDGWHVGPASSSSTVVAAIDDFRSEGCGHVNVCMVNRRSDLAVVCENYKTPGSNFALLFPLTR